MTLDRERMFDELEHAIERFAVTVEVANGDEPIICCPGWTMSDLVLHLGSIHRWAASIVLSGYRQLPEPVPLVDLPLATWYRRCGDALVAALWSVSPHESTPNFARLRETSQFWLRRQLHETTIHSVDAWQAVGASEPWGVTPDIAVDGIDEVLSVFFPRMTALGRRPEVKNRVRLDAVDQYDSWIVTPGSDPTGPPVHVHGNSYADTAVRGSVSELYLALWKRLPADRLRYDSAAGQALIEGPTVP